MAEQSKGTPTGKVVAVALLLCVVLYLIGHFIIGN